jgi:PTH1 family peptidyl-tRNA hydrolase
MKIILAQGNPGNLYKNTRHNIGFIIIDEIAKKFGSIWLGSDRFNSEIAKYKVANENILLVKPTTYYNDTGLVAASLINFYKIQAPTDFLVIHDDIALPFGSIRVRSRGSDGGNNGIKSINQTIGEDYMRIRIGTANELLKLNDNKNFVLDKFSKDELSTIKEKITPKSIELVGDFICNKLDNLSTKIS